MTDIFGLAALSLLTIPLGRTVAERLRAGDPPAAILDRLLHERWPDQPDKRSLVRSRADRAIERATASGIAAVGWDDPTYPPWLATIIDPPPVLWVRGSVAVLSRPAVAIVGSRAGSPYALAVADKLASDLTAHGLVVVSGLARGVDSAAHRGALARATEDSRGGQGVTIAVLGSGVDIVYPAEHKDLAGEIERCGAVVSELLPGTVPQSWFFPRRNRIISGLSRAVVVIEAGEKSGSLITARSALDQGREVLAVPGNVLSGRNRGAHALLRDGAKIVETADDILEELGTGFGHAGGCNGVQAPGEAPADPVLASMAAGEPCDLDAISERSGLAAARLLPRLLELELEGLVGRAGGGRFVRVDRTCYGEKKVAGG